LSTTALVTFESNDWKGGSWPISSANLTSGHVITYISEPGSVS
jgi:hypothetical protein